MKFNIISNPSEKTKNLISKIFSSIFILSLIIYIVYCSYYNFKTFGKITPGRNIYT